MSKTERVTENLVRKALQACGYEDAGTDIIIEEQVSTIEAVQRSLATVSKTGGGGKGAPEFIISNQTDSDILGIIECKADTKDHESALTGKLLRGEATGEDTATAIKRIQRFAVDGALHYARFLARDYHVIAIAVSGQTAAGMKVSTFIHTRGAKHAKALLAPEGASIEEFVPWADFARAATFDPGVKLLRFNELMAFSRNRGRFPGGMVALRTPA